MALILYYILFRLTSKNIIIERDIPGFHLNEYHSGKILLIVGKPVHIRGHPERRSEIWYLC